VQPSSIICGGCKVTFTVQFAPAAPGVKTATITITSNDADEDTYTFNLQGTGYVRGDVDADEDVDITDLAELLKVVIGMNTESLGCDVNFDGVVNVLDITVLERLLS